MWTTETKLKSSTLLYTWKFHYICNVLVFSLHTFDLFVMKSSARVQVVSNQQPCGNFEAMKAARSGG